MKEVKLKVFMDSIVNYFEHTNDPNVKVGSPYLAKDTKEVRGDFTGIITISGEYQGSCFVSAPAVLLKHLILSVGEKDTSEEMMIDTVGEIANTLSGNARKELGSGFIISAPKVVRGSPSTDEDETLTYVIPINWKSYKASLGVRLH